MNAVRCLILGWLLLAAGCVTTRFEAPKLTIVSAGMISADIFSQQFRIRLHVINPNNRELPIKGIDYKLYLQGDYFAEGVTNQPFVVPANGEAEFDTLVTTNFISSIGRLLDRIRFANNATVEYAFVGNVKLSTGLLRTLPFNEQGMVDLSLKK